MEKELKTFKSVNPADWMKVLLFGLLLLGIYYSEHRREPHPPCKVCGEPVKMLDHKFCSHKCWGIYLSKHQRGESNPNWKGVVPKRDRRYGTLRWQRLSKKIMKRDNYECQICHAKERKLDVHHIYTVKDCPELFWEESNLITLCTGCHNQVEGTGWGKELVVLPKFGEMAA